MLRLLSVCRAAGGRRDHPAADEQRAARSGRNPGLPDRVDG
jgi:hypothetical protein